MRSLATRFLATAIFAPLAMGFAFPGPPVSSGYVGGRNELPRERYSGGAPVPDVSFDGDERTRYTSSLTECFPRDS
ncbi:MAG: hypothetical protein JWL61_2389 [Gemmatimonadetes bacterium]|nr:hypothetical protein [Gemmatimonadota bacterium]